jgi:predicted outer membrane repeat protein
VSVVARAVCANAHEVPEMAKPAKVVAIILCALGAAASPLSTYTNAQQPLTTIVDLCESDDQRGGGTNLQAAIHVALTDRPDTPVTFACRPGSVIALHRDNYLIVRNLTIDGGNNVVLDAGARILLPGNPTFVVPTGASLNLKNITVTNGPALDSSGTKSSIIESDGVLGLQGATISNSESPITTRSGAIIKDAKILNNKGDAIRVSGDAWVESSVFTNNSYTGLRVAGTVSLNTSQFYGNGVGLEFASGSVQRSLFQANRSVGMSIGPSNVDHVAPRLANVSVQNSRFDSNLGSGVAVHAYPAPVKIRFTKSAFTRNEDGVIYLGGGAGEGPVDLSIFQTKFIANSAGGLRLFASKKAMRVEIKGSVFTENSASETGGAIFWSASGSLHIMHSVFTKNTAAKGGAALFGEEDSGPADIAMTNSIVADNSLPGNGAILEVDWIALSNVTIAKNRGRALQFAMRPPRQVIANTIISENTGGNCGGEVQGAFGPGNIQFGFADCPGVVRLDPALDTLYVPALGSPARGSGSIEVCRAAPVNGVDLVYQRRDSQGHCSSGAFEREPIQVATKLSKRVTTRCPDGSPMYGNTPCPDVYRTCANGEDLPTSIACPVRTEQPQVCRSYGQACRTAADCCNGPCISGLCRYP